MNQITSAQTLSLLRGLSGKIMVVACLSFLSIPLAQAQTWTPTGTGTYDWDNNANWSASPFPNAVDAVADFSVDYANPQTVNLNQAITVGSLSFTDNGATTGASTFNLAAGTSGSLILQTSSGNASISVVAPSSSRRPTITISADIAVNSDTVIDTTNSGSTSKQILLSGNLSGSGSITKDGSKGRLTVTGDNSAFTGSWILDGGVSTSYFRINSDNNLGAVPVSSTNNIIVNSNNTMEFTPGTYTINANRDILVNSGSLGLAVTAWNTYVTIEGDISGAGGITRTEDKGNSPYIRLSGNNTYTGQTLIRDGTLQAGSNTAFGVNSEVVMVTGTYDKNAVLDLNNFDNTIGSLSGGTAIQGLVKLGSATLTTGGNDLSTNYASIISGTGGLTKVGTGTMTLSEVNTYTGATTINDGTLAIDASELLDDSSDLVLGGGTFDSGGFNETFDTLMLNDNSTLDFGAGTSALVFSDSSALSWTGTLALVNFDIGTDTLRFGTTGSSLTAGQLDQLSLPGYSAGLDTDGFVVFAIPEPSTFALVGAFMFALVVSRSRKQA
ncbi:autotransporter-associated beta strand repeat-containing protein [Kiritimatiellaeota bacterium B1221]|nr:autotransporter-associated beta strand repeat-containing protein [Kiritimatiellaeota bacterium B1221]